LKKPVHFPARASLASFEKHAMADAPGAAACKERYISPMVIVRLFEVSA